MRASSRTARRRRAKETLSPSFIISVTAIEAQTPAFSSSPRFISAAASSMSAEGFSSRFTASASQRSAWQEGQYLPLFRVHFPQEGHLNMEPLLSFFRNSLPSRSRTEFLLSARHP